MQDLKVCVVQSNIRWKDKKANYVNYEKLIAQRQSDAHLYLLPEMFNTGFCFDVEELAEREDQSPGIEWLKKMAAELNAVVTASLMIREDSGVYNRLIWMRADGTYDTYDKRHLFSMSEEPDHFSAGTKKLMVDYRDWKICPMICYDLRFPVWIRNAERYDLLLFVANWPERRSMHWQKLLQARAIENQAYVVGCNRVGDDGNGVSHDGRSAVIDSSGEPLGQLNQSEGLIEKTLEKEALSKTRRYMPFLKDMDDFDLR